MVLAPRGRPRVEPILRHVVLHPATFRDHAFDAERLTRVQTTHASVPRARILPRHPPSFSLAGDERFTPASSSRRERGADHHARRGGARAPGPSRGRRFRRTRRRHSPAVGADGRRGTRAKRRWSTYLWELTMVKVITGNASQPAVSSNLGAVSGGSSILVNALIEARR